MLEAVKRGIDWFIPEVGLMERSDRSMARNFVFTHLCGPLLSQSICLFLYRSDPSHGVACWTIIACVSAFWSLPFLYRVTRDLPACAIISVQLLAFTSLFGTYYYGGVNSPFLPWLIVDLLLAFFYLSDRPSLVISLFTADIGGLLILYLTHGFPTLVPLHNLATVGWISILSATVYMSWMAIYYANIMSMRSTVERETEHHRLTAEQLMETKARADAANAAKSIFLAKMSHELRTPLNAVIGYSELLLEGMDPDDLDESKHGDLLCINAAGKHLLSLVTDVLDLSEIEADTVELRVEPFRVDDLVGQLVATTQSLASANRNRLTVQLAPDTGTVQTDQTKLRQIVINLLSNACKFTKDGTVALSVKRDQRRTGDWLQIQVRDTGIGLSPEDIQNLFQDFKQVSAGASGKYGGTGLGLSLSQRLCTLMGGAITVTSELGKGSCFTLRVPAEVHLEQTSPDDASTDSNLLAA